MVCRYCYRDFQLLSPLIQKIQTLENKVDELQGVIDCLGPLSSTIPTATSPSSTTLLKSPRDQVVMVSIWAVIVGAAGSSVCYWLFRRASFWKPLLFLSIGFPALSGLGAGLFIRGRHVKLYCVLGLAVGLTDFAVTIVTYQGSLFPLPDDWQSGFVFYIVGQTILFVLSGIIADWFESRFFHDKRSSPLSTRLATGLAAIGAGGSKDGIKDIEFWKSIINVLTPILAFIGSIITAYFTYLAALSKK